MDVHTSTDGESNSDQNRKDASLDARINSKCNVFHHQNLATASVRIEGLACRLAGSSSPEALWESLISRMIHICDPPQDREWHLAGFVKRSGSRGHTTTARAAYLPRVDRFDHSFFGIRELEARQLDPQQRMALELTFEAFHDALISPDWFRNVGVFAAAFHSDHLCMASALPHTTSLNPFSLTGNTLGMIANRISYMWDFEGPSMTIDTACSSGLTAVHLAVQSLQLGEADVGVVVGSNVLLSPVPFICYTQAGMTSPHGALRPFDAQASGFTRGEGCVALVLSARQPVETQSASMPKPTETAYATVRACGVNCDGRTSVLTTPNSEAQSRLIKRVLKKGRTDAGDVAYVEAHGTGTGVGDPTEAASISDALCHGVTRHRALPIGSVKGTIGHLEAASGLAGLLKVALCLQRKQLPPTAGFSQINPNIDFDGLNLRVLADSEPLEPTDQAGVGLMVVNSFGFGGANGCALVQGSARARSAGDRLAPVTVAASHFQSKAHPVVTGGVPLEPNQPYRSVRVGPWQDQAVVPAGSQRPRVLFVFGGQGTDYAHMGGELYNRYPVFRDAVDAFVAAVGDDDFKSTFCRTEPGATTTCSPHANSPAAMLQRHISLSIIGYQVAACALLKAFGVVPDAVIAHSTGEISASVVSGRLDYPSFIQLSKARATLQQDLSADGAMAAWGSDDLGGIDDNELEVACDNASQQLTLCGPRKAIVAAVDKGKASGIPCTVLKVQRAFHSCDVDCLLPQFETDLLSNGPLRSSSQPSIQAYSSVVGRQLRDGEDLDSSYWAIAQRQRCRFREACSAACTVGEGPWVVVEVSARPVLQGYLAKNFGPQPTILATGAKQANEENGFLQCLGQLYLSGVTVNWRAPGWNVYQPVHWNHEKPLRGPWWQFKRPDHTELSASAPTQPVSEMCSEPPNTKLLTYSVEWEAVTVTPAAKPTLKEGDCTNWMIFADRSGVGEALAQGVAKEKHVSLVYRRAGETNEHDLDGTDLEAVRGAVTDSRATRFAFLWPLDIASACPADSVVRCALAGLLHLFQSVSSARATSPRSSNCAPIVHVVTRGAFGPEGSCATPGGVGQALVVGFTRGASRDMALRVSLIDMCSSDTPDTALVNTLLETDSCVDDQLPCGEVTELCLHHGELVSPRLVPCELSSAPKPPLSAGARSVLITGGFGGIGLAFAQFLVEQAKTRRIILLGRRGLPETVDALSAVDKMRATGAVVVPLKADVSVAADVQRALQTLPEDVLPVTMIVHAAGIISDKALADLHWAVDFDPVVSPKAMGAWQMHQIMTQTPASQHVAQDACLTLFSSISGVISFTRSAVYSASNAYLDALAQYRACVGLHGRSVAWGPWVDVGMVADMPYGLKSISRIAPSAFIRASQGIALLGQIVNMGVSLAVSSPLVVVGSGYFTRTLEGYLYLRSDKLKHVHLVDPSTDTACMDGGEEHHSSALRRHDDHLGPGRDNTAGANASYMAIWAMITAQVREAMDWPPSHPVDSAVPLVQLGLDSLLQASLRHGIHEQCGIELPQSAVDLHPSVEKLANYLATVLKDSSGEGGSRTTEPQPPPLRSTSPLVGGVCDTKVGPGDRTTKTPELVSAKHTLPLIGVRAMITAQVREAMDWPPSHAVDSAVPLVQLGLDSLLQASLRHGIHEQCGIELPQSAVDLHPSIDKLAAHVGHVMNGTASTHEDHSDGVNGARSRFGKPKRKLITMDMVEIRPFDQSIAVEHARFVMRKRKALAEVFRWVHDNYSEQDSLNYAEDVTRMRTQNKGDAFTVYVEGRFSGMVSYQRQPMLRSNTLYLGTWIDTDGLSELYRGGNASAFALRKMCGTVFAQHADVWRVEGFIADWNKLAQHNSAKIGLWLDCRLSRAGGPLETQGGRVFDWLVLAGHRDCWNEKTMMFEKKN